MSIQVVQKKIPFLDVPAARLVFAAIERAGESGDQIEFAPEIRQRLKRPDLLGHALDAKKIDQFIRQRKVADIDTDAAVAELFGEKKKKTGAAAEIENVFRR